MTKLGKQFSEADEKKADELNQKINELEKKLGPDYVALMNGFQDIDSQSEVGQEISSMFTALDNLCGGIVTARLLAKRHSSAHSAR